jgi:hypothetical protein
MHTRLAMTILVWAAASAVAIGAVSGPSRTPAKAPAVAPAAPGAPGTAAAPTAAPPAASASPDELLARVKADALKGKLTDGLIAEFKDFAAAMAWPKLKAAGVSEEFWTWLSSHKELRDPLVVVLFPRFEPNVFKCLEALKAKHGDQVKAYHHLALAMALAYGRAGYRGLRAPDVRFADKGREVPSIEDSFGWYLKNERAMKMPLKTTPWPILLYVADNDLPLEERAWALQRYGSALPGAFGKIYYDVAYNDSLISQRGDPDSVWTLSTILSRGGICMHRGYYASRVLKSFGVPSIYDRGEGERGGHAWVAWVGRERESVALLFSGRFDYDRYYTGVMYDPLLRADALDRDLELKAVAIARSYPGWLDAMSAFCIAQVIQEENCPKALNLLEGAVQRNPYCDMPWRLVAIWCAKGDVSQELGEKMYDSMQKSFAAYPDLTFEVLSKILQPRMKPDSKPPDAEVAKNLQLLEKAFVMYEAAKRPDLAVRLRAFQGQYMEAVGRRDDALRGYVLASEKYANQHYGFLVLFDRAVKIMQEDKKQDMLLKYMAMMAAKVPEYQEEFNRKYDLKNTAWVHVVKAYVPALRTAGRTAEADTWEAKLPKPKKP